MGDLRENSEYKAALERQQFVQARLGQLRQRLSKLSQIDVTQIPADKPGVSLRLLMSDLAEARHRGFQTSEAAFQLGIVLSSISIVARARWLLFAGGGLGLVGVVLGANSFLLLVPPP